MHRNTVSGLSLVSANLINEGVRLPVSGLLSSAVGGGNEAITVLASPQ